MITPQRIGARQQIGRAQHLRIHDPLHGRRYSRHSCASVWPRRNGNATGVPGEGYFLKQADLSSISCLVYDVTGSSSVATPSVTISSAILDTPDTTAAKWRKGGTGYNFQHTLAGSNFPTGGSTYRVEYLFTTTGGNKYWLKIEGVADACYTS